MIYVVMVKQVVKLPGCITCGETIESAVANALDAKKAWLEAAIDEKIEIHEPDSFFCQKMMQRIPQIYLDRY